jgi:ATP-binding cassette subfamily B protein
MRYKLYVAILLVWLPILIIANQVIPPIIASNILDKLSSGDFVHGEVWTSFGSTLLIYAVILFFTNTLGWRLVILLVWKLEIKVTRDIIERIFDHLTKLDMEFHNNSFGGSLVSRSNKLVGSYSRLADTFIFQLYGLIIISISTGVVLWPKAPQFVVVFYTIAVIYILIAIKITKRIRQLSSIEASMQTRVTGYLADMVTNVMAVKSFSADKFENRRFHMATTDNNNASTNLMWAQLNRENIFATVTSTISIAALVLATLSVVVYDAEIGTVFLVLSLASNLTTRLWDFSQGTLRNINKALGDSEEAVEMLYRKPEVTDPTHPKIMPIEKGDIDFSGVGFSHDKIELFSDFNLKIAQGQKIGLIGHSGSGKTTLTKLLLRFKDIDDGSININGVDIRDVKQSDLRRVISYVPQEPLLFHRSLRENIAYGKISATMAEIEQAAKHAHAHEFIKNLDKGYDTLVGERGVKLSGGQKQRVAIARAMLKDAPILILDEATSALDSESETLIQDALWKLMEGKTAIVIAHRLSTIQKMDKIVVLDNGKIKEQGSHSELSHKKDGLYARLWKHQSGGFLQE